MVDVLQSYLTSRSFLYRSEWQFFSFGIRINLHWTVVLTVLKLVYSVHWTSSLWCFSDKFANLSTALPPRFTSLHHSTISVSPPSVLSTSDCQIKQGQQRHCYIPVLSCFVDSAFHSFAHYMYCSLHNTGVECWSTSLNNRNVGFQDYAKYLLKQRH